ncbi:hypothetical protein [Pedobacter sp. KBS0701]|uniref:hypothetical protein n=1 Tax=unclassified Pedobacter TaxID=2628915 RepID=UPI00110ECA36|nr:hypothetical protein [Pedobacter sp. KBS0701]QDW24820.1 hypothetical protein FFJ24_008345 [Pedobacter sp. KBS0701]
MKIIVYTICLSVIINLSACKNEKKQTTSNTISVVKENIDTAGRKAEAKNRLEFPEPDFSKMGNKVAALIPPGYDIDMEANGDLNHDGIEDKVIVLMKTKDTTAHRLALILLKMDNTYRVDAKSFSILGSKFREDGYQNYDFEDLNIDKNGQLIFTQQSTGPNGSIESTFKYINNELVLTHISSFAMGAGGQTELKLDLIKGIFEQTNINTMKEDMPAETTTKKYKLPKVLFANSDPKNIMINAYNKVGQ